MSDIFTEVLVSELQAKLTALRAAAEKMAERLRALQAFQNEMSMRGSQFCVFTEDDTSALAEWEALK